MIKKTQICIVLITLSACLGMQSTAFAQSLDTATLPNSGPKVELVASTTHIFIDDVVFEGLQAISGSDVERKFREQLAGLTKDAVLVSANVKKGARIIKQSLADIGYLNARVEFRIEDVTAKSKRITFVVNEGPPGVIRDIQFEGNKVFTDDELLSQLQLVTVMSHDVYDRATLDYDLNNPRNFMRSRGFLQARILEPKLNAVNGNLTIILPVREGRLYRIGEITVLGSERISAEQIVDVIGLKKGDIANGKRVSDALYEDLKNLYGNIGFPEYLVEPDSKFRDNPKAENEGIVDFQIKIAEGTCYKIGSIEFDGNKKLSEQQLRRYLLFKEGDTYNQQLLRDSLRGLSESGLVEPIDREDFSLFGDEESRLLSIRIDIREYE